MQLQLGVRVRSGSHIPFGLELVLGGGFRGRLRLSQRIGLEYAFLNVFVASYGKVLKHPSNFN